MAGLVDLVMSSLRDSKFKPIAPPLPVDDWVVGPGVRLGLPWPWYGVDERPAPTGLQGILRAEAPRSDWPASIELWWDPEPGSLDAQLPTLVRQVEDLHGARAIAVKKVRVHGSRAVVVCLHTGQGVVTWRVFTERGGHLIQGQMDVPERGAPGYETHLDTMLGTWSWEG